MRCRQDAMRSAFAGLRFVGGIRLLAEQRSQRTHADPACRTSEQLPPSHQQLILTSWIHHHAPGKLRGLSNPHLKGAMRRPSVRTEKMNAACDTLSNIVPHRDICLEDLSLLY